MRSSGLSMCKTVVLLSFLFVLTYLYLNCWYIDAMFDLTYYVMFGLVVILASLLAIVDALAIGGLTFLVAYIVMVDLHGFTVFPGPVIVAATIGILAFVIRKAVKKAFWPYSITISLIYSAFLTFWLIGYQPGNMLAHPIWSFGLFATTFTTSILLRQEKRAGR